MAIALEACGGGSSVSDAGCGGSAGAAEAGGDALVQVVVGLPGDTTATLQWVAPNDQRVRGYRIYHGTASRSYEQRKGDGIDVGNVTTHQVNDLEPGAIHYFAVTAYAAGSCESDYSIEAAKAIRSR